MQVEVGMSIAHEAYERLEYMIVTMEIPPGSLLSEGDLCGRLNLGRSPVREAVQRLAREKLVEIIPRRGIIVSEINAAKQMKLLQVRRVLERLVSQNAVRLATDVERQRMLELADEIVRVGENGDPYEYLHVVRECHMVPVAAADNEYLENAMSLLYGLSRRFWFAHHHLHAGLGEASRLHADWLRAIARGDEKTAVAASDNHMDFIAAFYRATIDASVRRSA